MCFQVESVDCCLVWTNQNFALVAMQGLGRNAWRLERVNSRLPARLVEIIYFQKVIQTVNQTVNQTGAVPVSSLIGPPNQASPR